VVNHNNNNRHLLLLVNNERRRWWRGSSSGSGGKELEERWRLSYYIIGWRCIGRDSKTGKSYAFFINSRRIKIRTILYTVQYYILRLR